MKRDNVGRHVIFAFVLALILYWVAFNTIEHFRKAKGPWHLTFQTDAWGEPFLAVSQSRLRITNVVFVLHGERLSRTNLSETVIFDSPITNVPFGRVVFLDTTFLPGTLTFDLFGHEIELLPRTLVVNRKEVPWHSGDRLVLSEREKITNQAPIRRK